MAEEVVTGADASSKLNPQPSLFILTQSPFSMMSVPGTQARMLFKGNQPTTEEKIPAYEVAGAVVTIRPSVARVPNYMAGGHSKYQLRVEGNTLWLMQKSTDLYSRIGDRVVPSSGPLSETRLKLVRLE